jgi:hypothetical protein
MLRSYVSAASALLLVGGCASTQLNYNTLDLASSTDNLVTQQVLYNFANFLDNPAAIPAQVTVSSGSATTSASITPSLTSPLSTGVTAANVIASAKSTTITDAVASKTFSLNAADTWNQSWSYAPVTDPERMKRLQALYRYAVDWSDWPGSRGNFEFVKNFPPIQRTVSISQPQCLVSNKGEVPTEVAAPPYYSKPDHVPDKPAPPIYVCATAVGTAQDKLSRGATTASYTNQQDDPYYLRGGHCILCGVRPANRKINDNLAGPWLRWQNLTGPNPNPDRLPRIGDVSLGRAGHYEFFTSPSEANKFVNFTVATLAAMSQAGSTSSSPSATTSSQGGGSKVLPATINGAPATIITE